MKGRSGVSQVFWWHGDSEQRAKEGKTRPLGARAVYEDGDSILILRGISLWAAWKYIWADVEHQWRTEVIARGAIYGHCWPRSKECMQAKTAASSNDSG